MVDARRTVAIRGLPRPNARIASLSPYRRAEAPAWVDLFCDGNEGPLPQTEGRSPVDWPRLGPETLRSYPDTRSLEAAFARRVGLEVERCAVFAGGDELLDRVCRAYLEVGDAAFRCVPGFSMIDHYATLAGARLVGPRWDSPGFPLEQALTTIRRERPKVAFLVSPNNPSGTTLGWTDLEAVAAEVPMVVLDHAYVEFADEDLSSRAQSIPNVVVLRTLSKAAGLAGLRTGFGLGEPEVLDALRTAGGPYSVSALSLAYAVVALEQVDRWQKPFVAAVRRERETLRTALLDAGFEVLPSEANFLLVREPEDASPRLASLSAALRTQGIAVRRFSDSVRITCAGPEHADRLLGAVRLACQPRRLLIDPPFEERFKSLASGRRSVAKGPDAGGGVDVTLGRATEVRAGDWWISGRGRDHTLEQVLDEEREVLELGGLPFRFRDPGTELPQSRALQISSAAELLDLLRDRTQA